MDLGGQLRLKLEHEEDFSPDRLVVSEPNREAVHTLNRWPQMQGGALALIGPAGTGKTHLAAIWAKREKAIALSVGDFAAAATSSAQRLLLDRADEATHGEAFFHLLNWATRPGHALLLTSRTPPKLWTAEVADLRSRLNALPVIELHEPDDAILRGVLVKLFKERNIRPSQDLLAYLILRMERSAPAARSIVIALDEAASAQHRPVSRALAREILKDETDDGVNQDRSTFGDA